MLDMGLEVTAKTDKRSAFTAGPGFCQFWQYLAGTRRRSENGDDDLERNTAIILPLTRPNFPTGRDPSL